MVSKGWVGLIVVGSVVVGVVVDEEDEEDEDVGDGDVKEEEEEEEEVVKCGVLDEPGGNIEGLGKVGPCWRSC